MSPAGYNDPAMMAAARELANQFNKGGKGKHKDKASKAGTLSFDDYSFGGHGTLGEPSSQKGPPKQPPAPRPPRGPQPPLDLGRLEAAKQLSKASAKAADFLSENPLQRTHNHQNALSPLSGCTTSAMPRSVEPTQPDGKASGKEDLKKASTPPQVSDTPAPSDKTALVEAEVTRPTALSKTNSNHEVSEGPCNISTPASQQQAATLAANARRRGLFAAKQRSISSSDAKQQ